MVDGTEVEINCEKGEGKDGYGVGSDCSATGYYIKKYWDNTYRATLYSGLNPILIRYADILLMNAEALAELGELDKTAWDATIKSIRDRAGFTERKYNSSGEQTHGGQSDQGDAEPPFIKFFNIAPPGLCTLFDAPTTTMLSGRSNWVVIISCFGFRLT